MKNIRPRKVKKTLNKLKVNPTTVTITRSEMDKRVFDIVLKTLYNNADKDVLHLEREIYAPANINLPHKEAERLWEVMTSSGLVTPVIGFGNAGKVELTNNGYQLMSQYGSYLEYLASIANNNQQPQTIILPIQVQAEEEPDAEKEVHKLPPPERKSKSAQKPGHKR
jgi:hypothetical protein